MNSMLNKNLNEKPVERHHFSGLTSAEVAQSREKYGENVLTPPEKTSLWVEFLEKFQDPLIKILLVALCLSLGISAYEVFGLGSDYSVFLEPIGIFVAVMLATVVGFVVEVNANKKFQLLNQVNDDINVKVVRDGKITEVPRREIVVGDVVMLETGEEVPADGELLDSMLLSINESTLTGEPMISKSHKPQEEKSKEKEKKKYFDVPYYMRRFIFFHSCLMIRRKESNKKQNQTQSLKKIYNSCADKQIQNC